MKKLLVVILFFILGPNLSSAQDFDKGLEAAQSGDFATALKEWKPLALQGDARAQGNIGVMYENGDGVPKDYAEAVKWYRLSAEQSQASGQNKLGNMYENGFGVLKDKAEAVKWYRLSAAQGNNRAQRNLGYMYMEGFGVRQDDVKAHMWFNIASANGNKNAAYLRDARENAMTLGAIEKATAMARECMKSDYKKCGY